jgi:LDH2 family malate/lactate/ureidoglycolate dehydrogenase
MIAGEPELQTQTERLRTGIPVEDKTWLDINNVAKQFGVQLH